MSNDWITDWISPARFQRYLEACDGDSSRALALYEWNVTLGQAIMRDLAHFEIAMRNAYDRAITAAWTRPDHWLLDPSSPAVKPIMRAKKQRSGKKAKTDINQQNRMSVEKAIRKCGGANATPGQVIAELSFGFWRQLTASGREKALWVPYLNQAYPAGTERKSVDAIIRNANTLRNRIAHHEPIFDRKNPKEDPERVHQDTMHVLSLLAPAVHQHLTPSSTVAIVAAQRP